MASIYESGAYLNRNPTWHAEDAPDKANAIRRLLSRAGLRPQTVGEVGCGGGYVLAELSSDLAADFHGFDISPDAAKLWTPTPRVTLTCGDFFADDRIYDLVLALDVVEHVPDYLGFLGRLLGKGRAFGFIFPLEMNALSIVRNVPIRTRDEVGHLHYFSKATALRTLEDCGYEITDWHYIPGAVKSAYMAILWPVRKALYALSPDLAVAMLGNYELAVLAAPRRV